MTDVIVRGKATRWFADDQPGWIEVSLIDADGREHRIIEKVPVLTSLAVTAASSFPLELWIRADADQVDGPRVHVTFAAAVETTAGLTGVDTCAEDVVWL